MTCMTPCIVLVLLSANPEPGTPARYRETRPAMGSTFEITLYAHEEAAARDALAAAFERVEALNGVFSDYETDSEANRLSRSGGTGSTMPVSCEMRNVLAWSLDLSEQSGGAFDVTVGPFTRLWRRARRRKELPDDQRLAAAKESVGYRNVDLDVSAGTVQMRRAGMRLDFGGVAKGRAADAALQTLRDRGLSRALVNAGGDLAVGDAPPGEAGWRIGVAPLQPNEPPRLVLQLTNCGVATSGDAWQYVEIDQQRYSHIVDPRTGIGLTRRSTVTVVARTGQAADGLASAVSVLGPERGVRLIQQQAGAACRVLAVEQDRVRTFDSDGWTSLPRAASE